MQVLLIDLQKMSNLMFKILHVIIDTVADDDVLEMPLDTIWNMTIDEVIQKKNLMNFVVGTEKEQEYGVVISSTNNNTISTHISYLS